MKKISILLYLILVGSACAGWYYSGSGVTYTANTAVFDGTNDWMRNTAATGATDGAKVSVSLWIKFNGADGAAQSLFSMASTTSTRFDVSRNSSNKIAIFARNGSGTTILDIVTSTATIVAGAWHHLLVAVDMVQTTAPNAAKVWIDGTQATMAAPTTFIATGLETIDLAVNRYTIGGTAANTPTQLLNGSLAEVWANDSYIDTPSSFATSGHPISLGTDGSGPTGSQPVWYLKGSANDFDLNDGTGEDFTITGSLTTDTAP